MSNPTFIFRGHIVTPSGYASSKHTKKDREKNTSFQALPVSNGRFIIPGEQLAGALRRAGLQSIRSAFPDEEVLTSVLSFFQATVGGVAGFGREGYAIGELSNLRAKNPFISLWGKAGMRGHLGLGHAEGPEAETLMERTNSQGEKYIQTVSHAQRVHGFRQDDFARTPDMTMPKSFWSERDVLRYAASDQKSTLELADYAEKNADFMTFQPPVDVVIPVVDDEAEQGESTQKLTNIQNGYGGFEYLPAGTMFNHTFTFTGDPREQQMLMACFYGFAEYPRIGGHWRHDLGWVDMQYVVYQRQDDLRLPPVAVGSLTIRSHMDDADMDKPAIETTGLVTEWLDAYLVWRGQLFEGMDINAGAEKEYKIIADNLRAIKSKVQKAAAKKKPDKGKGKATAPETEHSVEDPDGEEY